MTPHGPQPHRSSPASWAHPHMGLRMLDFYDELADRAAASSWEEAVGAMPKSWWAQLGAFGTLDDAAAYVMSMTEAGVDAIAFFPGPFDPSAPQRSWPNRCSSHTLNLFAPDVRS
ncbi:MAG: hypothetical protein R2710_23400 [Acidimicrobiales bacterium]